MEGAGQIFEELVEIMYRLRQQCPWDRKQTSASLREYILEEAYEAIEAIDNQQWDELKGELGDLLLQIVFQGVIAEEKNYFKISDIIQSINKKLIERHPHVFSDVKVNSATEVAQNWEQIKRDKENRHSILQGIPRNLNALLRSQKIQQKVAKVGFDWNRAEDVIGKIEEELEEFKESVRKDDREAMEEEIGDFLFSIVNMARWKGINAEDALRATSNKFISRFQYVERQLAKTNRSPKQATLQEMDALWEESKQKDKP